MKYWVIAGSCDLRVGKIDSALEYLEQAYRLVSDKTSMRMQIRILSLYGFLLSQSGQCQAAIDIINPYVLVRDLTANPYWGGYVIAALASAYYYKGDWLKADEIQRQAVQLAERVGDPELILDRNLQLGKIQQRLGNDRAALKIYEKVIGLARKISNPHQLLNALLLFSTVKISIDEPDNVEGMLLEALQIAEKMNNPDTIASCLMALSNLLISTGQLDRANIHLERSATLIQQVKNMEVVNRILRNMATIALRKGNWERATNQYNTMLTNARKQRNLADIAYTYLLKSNVLKYRKIWDKAWMFAARANRIWCHLDKKMPDVLIIRAEIMLGMEKISEALSHAKKALSESDDLQLNHSKGYAHRVLGQIYHRQGEFEKSRQHLNSAFELFQRRKDLYELAIVHLSIGELHQTTADIEKSLLELKQAKALFSKLGATFLLNRVDDSLCLIQKMHRTINTRVDPILSTFEQLTVLINSITDSDQLLERILDVAIRFVHAERGLIILNDWETGESQVRAVRNLDESTSRDASNISRTVLQEAADSDATVFTGNAPTDPRFSTVKSVKTYNILSLICVPLRVHNQPIGTIYVDSRRVVNLFNEFDRRFMQAFANLAAVAIERSHIYAQQEAEKQYLREKVEKQYQFANFIGKSKVMHGLFERLRCVSRTDVAVLITGASGTGKDLAACAIHYNSDRRKRAFIAVNCAAIPETLVESELFGHVKGAFTDAKQDKKGRFEAANGGTLFLDEIGELPVNIQAKLLRAIDTKEIARLGEDLPRKVDVRIIAATNRDLPSAIEDGTFRNDFYYRLRVAEIKMPDLKDHSEDIPLLCRHFLKKLSKKNNRHFSDIGPRAMEVLVQYHWPGNVRELEHAIESAVVFGKPPSIGLKDLPQEIHTVNSSLRSISDHSDVLSLMELEAIHIKRTLEYTRGNKVLACQYLKISRPTLDRKLKKYRILLGKNHRNH